MTKKVFFIILKGPSLKQIIKYFFEAESPTLSDIEQVGLSVALWHISFTGDAYGQNFLVYILISFLHIAT